MRGPCKQRVVRRFDRNRDGLISYKEFMGHFKSIATTHSRVDVAEASLQQILQRIISTTGLPPLAALRKEFQAVDADGSGALNAAELRRALSKWGADVTPKEAKVRVPCSSGTCPQRHRSPVHWLPNARAWRARVCGLCCGPPGVGIALRFQR